MPTKKKAGDADGKSSGRFYERGIKRGARKIVFSLAIVLALPGLAIAAVDLSPSADFDSIIVTASQIGCEHIGGDAIAAGFSIDLGEALGDSRSLSVRQVAPSLIADRENDVRVSVRLHCHSDGKVELRGGLQRAATGEWLENFLVDGTTADLLALRIEVKRKVYQRLSIAAEGHTDKLSDTSVYLAYLTAIGGVTFDDDREKIRVLKTSIEVSDAFGPLWAQFGAAQLRLGEADFRNADKHFAAAEDSLDNALDINPAYPLSIDNLAAVYMRTGRTEEAAHLLRQAIAARPNSATLRSRLGYTYRYAGLLEKSVLEYRLSEALDSRLANVVSAEGQIAKARIYQGRYEDALRSYRRIRSILAGNGQKPDGKTLFYEGLTYFYSGQRQDAVQLFDAANATRPDTLWSRFAIAYKHAALDRHENLVSIARLLEKDNIADGERRYRLAHFYALAGQHDEALNHLDAALEAGNFNYAYISRDPFLESIRSTKGYNEIIHRMKNRHTTFQDGLTESAGGESQ